MPEDDGERDDVSERVARGFEALVSEESAVHGGPPPPANPPAASPPAVVSPGPGEAPMSIAATRLVALEGRVRQTMDRLTELVEAQLPETVDGLRADLETLRLELQTSLAQATELMADERRQLRSQIATTVGAANRWFVRARDHINERLDRIAEQAEMAAAAATATVSAFTGSYAEGEVEGAEALALDDGADAEVGEDAVEWGVEDEEEHGALGSQGGPAAGRALPRPGPAHGWDAPDLGALRGDLQELQLEVSTMGEAVSQLTDQVAKLTTRLPARPRGVKLAAGEVELIVEAVMAALPARAPAPRPRKAASPARRKEPPLKAAADALAKKQG